MSITRHHAEWLSLLEVSGPFLSMPVLLRTFPAGLGPCDPDLVKRTLLACAEWREGPCHETKHRAWIRFVLQEVLGYEPLLEASAIPADLRAEVPEFRETLRPDYVLASPSPPAEVGRPRMLVLAVPLPQHLERALRHGSWAASPAQRMHELLRATGVRLGLVTNGEQWMLVHASPDEPTGYTSWYASLWQDEPCTFQAFCTLLGARRVLGLPGDLAQPRRQATHGGTLEELLAESAQDQQALTDQLGFQVRRAVEVLVRTLDRLDHGESGEPMRDVPDTEVYAAALTVMMRLVFLLCAEERGLFPVGDPLYGEHYAISTLGARLRESADRFGEEVLEHRKDAWCRLLATFRAVHGGVHHDRLCLPAYGGGLFDPDRFAFLEGRARGSRWRDTLAHPLPVDNRTVLHLLEALQFLQVRVPGGGSAETRRLSFRALDIEQIGHVYEGLLDHTATRATEPMLGLAGTKDKEPEVPLALLEEHRRRGLTSLVKLAHEKTGRSASAITRTLELPADAGRRARISAACGHDVILRERVLPFAHLVRDDSFGNPVVIRPGGLYVTRGTDRRSSGTHYTPRSLTEPVVRHALEPLVFEGPAPGWPREQWRLRSPEAILGLRICDMAMGSGAFLVQACRTLAEYVVEAWQAQGEEAHLPADVDDRLALARRMVADRCLYGVDKNPMAVEMAKVSLWLATLQEGRPFSFLDHALKCGDSLLGITSAEQLDLADCPPALQEALGTALEKRRQLAGATHGGADHAPGKAALLKEADHALASCRAVADLVTATALQGTGRTHSASRTDVPGLAAALGATLAPTGLQALQRHAEATLQKDLRPGDPPRRPFHWPLEFPEVFPMAQPPGKRGFDAVVGNPPFVGGQKITGALGTAYRRFLVQHVAAGRSGSADLCAYFFLRAFDLLKDGGSFGLVSTNSIAQGETREVGLQGLLDRGARIVRAVASRKWPGQACLEVSHVWGRRGGWHGRYHLDDREVEGIDAYLAVPGRQQGAPLRLRANVARSYQGTIVAGLGFVLDPAEATALLQEDPRNHEVLQRYLNGEDVTSRPDQSPSRWVINFRDWPLSRAEAYAGLLDIVTRRVKPERETNNNRDLRTRWWQFSNVTKMEVIARQREVLIGVRHTKHWTVTRYRPHCLFSDALVVFLLEGEHAFAVMTSSIHEAWARHHGSTLETRFRYTPSTCFETFPFPEGPAPPDVPSPAGPAPVATARIGAQFECARREMMRERAEGLTAIYNRLHDPQERSAGVAHLRSLQVALDQAVAAAYGWTDLDLGHDFVETKQGPRHAIAECARREILDRLLALNHERHAQEAHPPSST